MLVQEGKRVGDEERAFLGHDACAGERRRGEPFLAGRRDGCLYLRTTGLQPAGSRGMKNLLQELPPSSTLSLFIPSLPALQPRGS